MSLRQESYKNRTKPLRHFISYVVCGDRGFLLLFFFFTESKTFSNYQA